jgi:heme/copper-type cytochrome/quinol oxidase subunit 2
MMLQFPPQGGTVASSPAAALPQAPVTGSCRTALMTSALIFIPVCTLVVIGIVAWLFWLGRHASDDAHKGKNVYTNHARR